MDVEEIKESMDTCCGQTGFDIRQVKKYIEELEQEISDLKTALDANQAHSKYEIERLGSQLAILVLSSGTFLVGIVLMLIF